ncbi:hypothetical protein BDV10DRAFT_177761 [Aspergillus recurvatus]
MAGRVSLLSASQSLLRRGCQCHDWTGKARNEENARLCRALTPRRRVSKDVKPDPIRLGYVWMPSDSLHLH